LPSRFSPETAHDGIVDVQRRLHMANHIHYMAICQPPAKLARPRSNRIHWRVIRAPKRLSSRKRRSRNDRIRRLFHARQGHNSGERTRPRVLVATPSSQRTFPKARFSTPAIAREKVRDSARARSVRAGLA
jgi:hypothetical protein